MAKQVTRFAGIQHPGDSTLPGRRFMLNFEKRLVNGGITTGRHHQISTETRPCLFVEIVVAPAKEKSEKK
jgi:hypothetical protein